MVAVRARVELHHQPVLDAHGGHLDEHLPAERLLAGRVERARQRAIEQSLRRHRVDRGRVRRRVPVIGGGGAERDGEFPAVEQRGEVVVPPGGVAPGDLAEALDVVGVHLVVGIDHRVRSERRDHPAGETVGGETLVVGEVAQCSVGRGDDLDAEPVEQRPGPERVVGEAFGDAVVRGIGRLAGETGRDAEHVAQHMIHPEPRRCAAEQMEVLGKRAPDVSRRCNTASPGSPASSTSRGGIPSASSGTPWL